MDILKNLFFILSFLFYTLDWYDYLILGDRSIWIYIALICLTIYFIGELPIRINMYKKFKTIWY